MFSIFFLIYYCRIIRDSFWYLLSSFSLVFFLFYLCVRVLKIYNLVFGGHGLGDVFVYRDDEPSREEASLGE